jgi:putative ABC transport system permease protein
MRGSVRWRKIRGDLGQYRARTALVVASVAIGAFAVGTIAGTDALLRLSLNDGYAATRPAAASIYTATGFDRDLVDVVRAMPGVGEAEGRRSVVVRLLAAGGTSREMLLTALPDFADQRIDLVNLQAGRFPPRRGEVAFERSSLRLMDIAPGETIRLRTPGGREHDLVVSGLAHEPGASPAFYFGRLNAYVTFETLEDLGWDDSFDELRIRVDHPAATRAEIQAIADDVRLRVERAGVPVTFALVPEPGKHPADALLQAVFVVLGAIGLLSLVMSGFLVANTVSVIVTQQTRQIGLMKAVGGRDYQIAGMYVALVLVYGFMALAIAIPLAAVAALGLASLAAGLLNFDVTEAVIPLRIVALMVAIGLFVPLGAAAVPLWRGVRMTVHEAIRDSGGADHYGHGRLEAFLARLRGPSRPVLLSIRNTFRRRTRLALTLIALALGGTVFMSVFTVRDSLYATLEETVRYFDYDVQVELAEPARAATVTAEALQVPGVVVAEPWRFASAQRVRPDGSESASRVTFGLPPGATTVRPVVMEGRWLLPGEGNALVATANLLGDEADLRVGDAVTLRIQGRDTVWTLVGIVQSPTMAPFLYVGSDALERSLGDVGRASIVMIGTNDHTPAGQARIGAAVRERLEAAGIGIASTTTTSDVTDTLFTLFDTLVLFISVMSVLLGVVGGLGLAGTMTMNVVERSREIGIIRAIGATDQAVLLIFLAEGLLIGFVAWTIGALLSVPISWLLSNALGQAFVQRPLDFQVSWQGVTLWFMVVFWLSTFGSILPAWRAARISVREVLAYE